MIERGKERESKEKDHKDTQELDQVEPKRIIVMSALNLYAYVQKEGAIHRLVHLHFDQVALSDQERLLLSQTCRNRNLVDT